MSGQEPYLIRPVERPLDHIEVERPGRRQPVTLPEFACVGRFFCSDPARDKRMDFSQLVVIWFQDDFAPPLDPKVGEQLRAIDWDRHAEDGIY